MCRAFRVEFVDDLLHRSITVPVAGNTFFNPHLGELSETLGDA
ncbi:hypothetical protein L525_1214 [Bordetella bronchiseptica MBORD782]|nr:hypothetical protein L525_1214 [Bordetella bronchiseptica MBORD782]